MKICPTCQETNHDHSLKCMLCGATLHAGLGQSQSPSDAQDARSGEAMLLPTEAPLPAAGSLVVAVYHDTEAIVAHYHVVTTDITTIGREDADRGIFPDLDLASLGHCGVDAGRVSRRHARLIRRGHELQLDVLDGTTGTQVNRTLLDPGQRMSIESGTRIILAGRTRLKLLQL